MGCFSKLGAAIFVQLPELRKPRRVVIGNDPDKERIEVARRTIRGRPNIQFVAQDCRELNIDNLDGVVIADVLHRVPFSEQQAILANVYETLRPGGCIVMCETDIRTGFRYLLFFLRHRIVRWRPRQR